MLYHMDEPNGDPSAVALYFLSRASVQFNLFGGLSGYKVGTKYCSTVRAELF